jgi:hypothetical protein
MKNQRGSRNKKPNGKKIVPEWSNDMCVTR